MLTCFFLPGKYTEILKNRLCCISPSPQSVNEEGSLLPKHNDPKTNITTYQLQIIDANSYFKSLQNYWKSTSESTAYSLSHCQHWMIKWATLYTTVLQKIILRLLYPYNGFPRFGGFPEIITCPREISLAIKTWTARCEFVSKFCLSKQLIFRRVSKQLLF